MQNQLALARIRRRVMQLAVIIAAPDALLPTFGSTEDWGRPHIEVVGELPYYVVVERGQELTRESFADDDALLERVFNSVTVEMAGEFELRNRRSIEDPRRLLFAKQLELIATLDPEWAARSRARITNILREFPFVDQLEPKDAI